MLNESNGIPTTVIPEDLTANLLDVACVPDIAFNLFLLMAAYARSKIHDYIRRGRLVPALWEVEV